MKNKVAIALPGPQANYGSLGDKLQFCGEAMPEPTYIEKLVTFTVTSDGKVWDAAIFPGGELAPSSRLWRLKIPVPVELISGEVVAEVSEPQAQEKPEEEERRKSGTRFWRR